MTNYRRRNYGTLQPDPAVLPPQGKTFIYADRTEELDGSVYINWTYIGDDEKTLTGYLLWFAFFDNPDTTIKEVVIPPQTTDALVDGFANGTRYRVRVVSRNSAGNGMLAAATTFTPRLPEIPAPTLTTLTGGEGQALAEWEWGKLRNGYTYQYMSYQAVNEVGAVVEEHVLGGEYPNKMGVLPLADDHDWKCALVAVTTNDDTGRFYVSGLSNAITVRVEGDKPPAAPTITDCHLEGAYIVLTWRAAYDARPKWWQRKKRKAYTAPTPPTRWDIDVDFPDGSEAQNVYVNSEPLRTYKMPKLIRPDTYTVRLRGTNDLGFGDYSEPVYVTYTGAP